MQTPWTLALIVTLVFAVTPLAQAGTDSDQYMTAGGVVYEPVGGTTAFACPDAEDDCDLDGDGERDIPWAVGAAELRNPDGPVQNVVASTNDDLYGANAATIVCVYHPESDWTHCGPPDDVYSDVTCGTVALLGWPWSSDYLLVGVYTIFVAEDLEVCGSTSGTVTADFF